MIEIVPLVSYSSWKILLSLGCRRSNRLLRFLLIKLSICHVIWLRNLLKKLGLSQEISNKSAITLAKNHVFYDQSKHFNALYHFIRDCIERKDVQAKYVRTQDQTANIFTKPLKQEDFI